MEKHNCKLSGKTLDVIEKREKLKKLRNKTTAQKIDFSETCKLTKNLIRQDICESNLKCIELHINKTGAVQRMKKDLITVTSWMPSTSATTFWNMRPNTTKTFTNPQCHAKKFN